MIDKEWLPSGSEKPSVSKGRHSTGSTAILFAVVIFGWGGNYALVKLSLADISPFIFNAIRFSGATVVLAAPCAFLPPVNSQERRVFGDWYCRPLPSDFDAGINHHWHSVD